MTRNIVEWVIVISLTLLWNGYLIYKMRKDEDKNI
jgi:hypothetical protein